MVLSLKTHVSFFVSVSCLKICYFGPACFLRNIFLSASSNNSQGNLFLVNFLSVMDELKVEPKCQRLFH